MQRRNSQESTHEAICALDDARDEAHDADVLAWTADAEARKEEAATYKQRRQMREKLRQQR
jgi:hypothetical protein